uniref:Alpha/beta hydrolase fold-3 domain-containing protein n=1 Tax=Leersia perrieri TaxID=77586 RepID=A0A0D9WVT3_9ORYZ
MAPAAEEEKRVVVDDCRGVLLVYSDGAVERKPSPGFTTPVRDDGSVEWKDAVFDPTHGLSLRLYRPRHALAAGGEKKRLPVFFYYHGGGFCIGSRTWPNCHNYCLRLSSDLDALVVAPDYRLAPEFPLPAAFLDAQSSLLWLASSAAAGGDPWIDDVADFTRVFVSGDSAGGTIAHHLAVRFSGGEVGPIRVAGYVQLMPFYGGVERTPSEAACPDDAFLNLALNDRYWRLSLPVGATADHPYANPFAPENGDEIAAAEFAPTMVVVGGRDLLRDRAVDYAERMKAMGKPVEVVEFEGQQHGFFTIDPWSDAAGELMVAVKRFLLRSLQPNLVDTTMPTMPAVDVADDAGGGAATAASPCANDVVEDLAGFLRVLSDGTILRSPVGPTFCPSTFPSDHPSVEWKEEIYDKAKNLHVRMYKPSSSSPSSASGGGGGGGEGKKMPVVVYFHGGGFCLGSCTWANVHAFCLRLAADAGAVVLSAGYRLAPEHRLPAAVDDAAAFLNWLADGEQFPTAAWLSDAADFRRVFVAGDSAGGTIAHHLAVRAASNPLADDAIAVCGYVLLMPFFGGIRRTASEEECPAEVFLNLDLFDRFWRLSLPVGATRDHPMANPFGPESPELDGVELRPLLVVAGGLDMLRDRAVDYAGRLSTMCKPVELAEFAGEHHGFFTLGPGSDATGELIAVVSRFIHATGVAAAAAPAADCFAPPELIKLKRTPPMSSSSSSSSPPPHVVEDCLGIVQLLSDGTVRCSGDYSSMPILSDAAVPSDLTGAVQWKDVVYDAGHGLRLRIYTPTTITGAGAGVEEKEKKKLPILVYFHGGGFCIGSYLIGSYEMDNFHACCLRLAADLPAVVLSADYRLAPEHRLPAAHLDAASVLSWLVAGGDPWLDASADFDKVFVCGDSCGGNIAHHLAVAIGSGEIVLSPTANLAGCVMLWPYFGGEARMPSEDTGETDTSSPVKMGIDLFDQMWRLALPEGASRDHPAANPFGPESARLDGVELPPVLVVDPELDVMRDRVADYAARLRDMGKRVELVRFDGQGHGFFVMDPMGEASGELVRVVRRFPQPNRCCATLA